MLVRIYDILKNALYSKCVHMKNRILIWGRRSNERHKLSLMSERELWDIRVSLSDAHKEINKKIWHP